MRIRSGSTTHRIPFLAIDDTDLLTRLTGLTDFTVYRSRNGGAATAMDTPTVIESDATNMPGLYWLLVDEDTTIDAGFIEQQMVLHITKTGMYPVSMNVDISHMGNMLPETLDEGFVKASTKKVGLTILTPGGAGGQKYGGA
jgi:hypothetical protein